MSDNGSTDRVADAGEAPRLVSQGVLDAVADAQTLVVNARPRFASALWTAQAEGSRAFVAILDGDGPLAQTSAYFAAHAAFQAVPALRG